MARLVLHIGTHKTATTTLQDTFAANRALLAREGLIYPKIGQATGHHGLVMEWLALPPVYALPGGPAAAWGRIAALARGPGVVFLSSEEFSRGQPLPRVDFRALRQRLAGFEGVTVLCTLRDQLSYLQSIYLEVSKKQVPQPWSVFLAEALTTGYAAGLFLDFAALDGFLRTAFAPDEIRYLDFATARGAPGGILGAALQAAGCDLPAAALRQVEDGAANVSPDPLAAWAANQIAAPYPVSEALLALTTAALRADLDPAVRTTLYTRAEEVRLLQYVAPLNARFAESLAARQPGFRITMAPPPPRRMFREDVQPGFWLRVARRLHADAA